MGQAPETMSVTFSFGLEPDLRVLPVSLRKFVRQTTVFGSRGYDANTR